MRKLNNLKRFGSKKKRHKQDSQKWLRALIPHGDLL
jgi:hypothetical protein